MTALGLAVSAFARVPAVLVINPARLNARNLAEFIEIAKKKPGEISIAHNGVEPSGTRTVTRHPIALTSVPNMRAWTGGKPWLMARREIHPPKKAPNVDATGGTHAYHDAASVVSPKFCTRYTVVQFDQRV